VCTGGEIVAASASRRNVDRGAITDADHQQLFHVSAAAVVDVATTDTRRSATSWDCARRRYDDTADCDHSSHNSACSICCGHVLQQADRMHSVERTPRSTQPCIPPGSLNRVPASLQTDNHASIPPLSYLQAGCPSCRPTNSVKALKAHLTAFSMR